MDAAASIPVDAYNIFYRKDKRFKMKLKFKLSLIEKGFVCGEVSKFAVLNVLRVV
jgi:hypothetical protein